MAKMCLKWVFLTCKFKKSDHSKKSCDEREKKPLTAQLNNKQLAVKLQNSPASHPLLSFSMISYKGRC
jgi:hypothetical protein